MKLIPGRFYTIELKCMNNYANIRAKDVNLIEMNETEKKNFNYDDISPTHYLVFYDCLCGIVREIPGIIEKNDDKEIIFAVSSQKKYHIKELMA